MTRKKNLPILHHIEVADIAAEGKAIARVEGKVLFIPMTIPGDIIDVQIIRKKKSFMEGKPVVFHKYSEKRVNAFCSHFGHCGGCSWQHLKYEEQLKAKQQQVYDQLERIGKLALSDKQPIESSDKTMYYRNKMEFTFSDKRWFPSLEEKRSDNTKALGFHVPRHFDKVLDIENCYLQADPSNDIRKCIKNFALQQGYSFFDLRSRQGWLRNLVVRNSSTGGLMVIVVFFYDDIPSIMVLLEHMKKEFPMITSLYYIINTKRNDSYADLDAVLFSGDKYIKETIDDLFFYVGPKSFFQVNVPQAAKIYAYIKQCLQLQGNEILYDLYTGTGTIAIYLARSCKKVVGMEYVKDAVNDAILNAAANNIQNAVFLAGDIKNIFSETTFSEHGTPDVVILDPPRAGIHADVAKALLAVVPQKIVYVSCNPATQARDVQLLTQAYDVTHVRPFDMFPHTHHVENVIVLNKR